MPAVVFLRIFLTCLCLVALCGAPRAQQGATPVAQPAGEFLTEWLEYVGWDGAHWSVRREGGGFLRHKRGAAQPAPDAAIDYVGWDGARWSARWSGDAFAHARQGDTRVQQDAPLQFVDWQGRRWSARWDAPARKFRVRAGG